MPNGVILGSTGSIVTLTLDVLRSLPDFQVLGLAAGTNNDLLRAQIAEFRPKIAAILRPEQAKALAQEIAIPVYSGPPALEEMAPHPHCDLVVVAVVGAAGLRPNLADLRAGKRVA